MPSRCLVIFPGGVFCQLSASLASRYEAFTNLRRQPNLPHLQLRPKFSIPKLTKKVLEKFQHALLETFVFNTHFRGISIFTIAGKCNVHANFEKVRGFVNFLYPVKG